MTFRDWPNEQCQELILTRYAHHLLASKEFETVRELLDDDWSLHKALIANLSEVKAALRSVITAIDLLLRIQSCPNCKGNASWSDLYIQAMSNELADSSMLEGVLTSLRTLPSDIMRNLLHDLTRMTPQIAILQILQDLEDLIRSANDSNPLRSQYDVHHDTLRTTVIAQRVSLSKNTSALSPQDTAYTKIADRVSAELQAYFQNILVNPQDLFLNEIFIYDSKSPYREVFTPRPRFAVERALSSPQDYLGCDCCGSADGGLSATQPATAILYQLYLESGSLINTADLWSAFWTIVGGEDAEDEEAEQENALALFSRGLAELKYLGLIKSSKKKVDHLQKLSWKGL